MNALKRGARAYLDKRRDKGRVRLVLIYGPAVLGHEAIRTINDQSAGETLQEGLEYAIASGEIRPLPVAALSALLDVAFDRAAPQIDDGAPHDDSGKTLDGLLEGLAPQQ